MIPSYHKIKKESLADKLNKLNASRDVFKSPYEPLGSNAMSYCASVYVAFIREKWRHFPVSECQCTRKKIDNSL